MRQYGHHPDCRATMRLLRSWLESSGIVQTEADAAAQVADDDRRTLQLDRISHAEHRLYIRRKPVGNDGFHAATDSAAIATHCPEPPNASWSPFLGHQTSSQSPSRSHSTVSGERGRPHMARDELVWKVRVRRAPAARRIGLQKITVKTLRANATRRLLSEVSRRAARTPLPPPRYSDGWPPAALTWSSTWVRL
jgi:hypothetical protein